jgi:hypothetical protein
MTKEELRAHAAARIAIAKPVSARTARTPLPCVHIGDPIRTQAVAFMKLDTNRRWRLCNRGYVAAVCDCAEGRDSWCGPKCPGYESQSEP